jgi:hypothetical protein
MQDIKNVTVEDFFAIVGASLLITLCAFLWVHREYWLPAAAAIWRGLRTVGRALYHLSSAAAAERRCATRAPVAPARTRAYQGADDAWLSDEFARGAQGAGVRAEDEELDAGLDLAPDEIAAVARMIAHNKTLARPNKLTTIQAGWPEIKNRSGDPRSKYARAGEIYNTFFNPPAEAKYPTLLEQRRRISAEGNRP